MNKVFFYMIPFNNCKYVQKIIIIFIFNIYKYLKDNSNFHVFINIKKNYVNYDNKKLSCFII